MTGGKVGVLGAIVAEAGQWSFEDVRDSSVVDNPKVGVRGVCMNVPRWPADLEVGSRGFRQEPNATMWESGFLPILGGIGV
jgi:hypothetical protein